RFCLLDPFARRPIEAPAEPPVELPAQCGVADFVAGDTGHGGANDGVLRRSGLVAGNEGAGRFADATLDRVGESDLFERACRPRLEPGGRVAASEAAPERARLARVADLVARGPSHRTIQLARKAMTGELASQNPERVDRGGLETRHAPEVVAEAHARR